MTHNDEMRAYLDYLVSHERDCARESCPTCQSAQNIYESVRGVIFADVTYPGVAITARRGVTQAANATGNGRRASAKKAA
ncbi:MAG: hypothetical protein LAP40_12300 [Acidobacteriia bacterium]|nr:hypothetical protein [Terriglobia bacterium]